MPMIEVEEKQRCGYPHKNDLGLEASGKSSLNHAKLEALLRYSDKLTNKRMISD